MKKYQIECTEEQLRLIMNAVEDWHRFISGQCELDNATCFVEDVHEVRRILNEQVRPHIVPKLPHIGSSYGWSGSTCPNKHQKKMIAMSYGIWRQIAHFFALQRKDNDWDVYRSDTLTCPEQGGLITIKVIEDEKR
jgi:hypothetical protein